jgi:hypothetical protein
VLQSLLAKAPAPPPTTTPIVVPVQAVRAAVRPTNVFLVPQPGFEDLDEPENEAEGFVDLDDES